MKSSVIISILILVVSSMASQQPYQDVPCYSPDASEVESFEGGLLPVYCLESGSEADPVFEDNFTTTKGFEADVSIVFNSNFTVLADDNVEFKALLGSPSCMKPYWYEPYETPGTITCFDKLELGFALPIDIETKIQNFITNTENGNDLLQPVLNPFDPDQVNLQIWINREFTSEEYVINGFYFQDFERLDSDPDVIEWTWSEVVTDHHFRTRWTPRKEGSYFCGGTLKINDTLYCSFKPFPFVVEEGYWKNDFVRVSENHHYFQIGSDSGPNKVFMPIGLNLADGCECEIHEHLDGDSTNFDGAECYITGTNDLCASLYKNDRGGQYMNSQQTPVLAHMEKYQERIDELAASGANSFRLIMQPHMYDLEFEEVGNYAKHRRMRSAWEFDSVLNKCHHLNLRMQVNQQIHHTLEERAHYTRWKWDWGDSSSCGGTDPSFAYRNTFNLNEPVDFLTDSTSISWYKKKLRYIYARWGYSPNIFLWELFSEMNNIGYESDVFSDSTHCESASTGNMPYANSNTLYTYRTAIENWNQEMADYIKNELHATDQLLTTSYTGMAPIGQCSGLQASCFDSTFCDNNMDVISWNAYGNSYHRWGGMGKRPDGEWYRAGKMSCDYQEDNETWIAYKPIINSENGVGDYMQCEYSGFLKDLYAMPFTGRASSGMSWDETANSYLWSEFGKLKYFLENFFFNSTDIESDVWFPGYTVLNQFGTNNSPDYVECVYLHFQEEDHRRFVGVLMNRTVNSYSTGLSTPCAINPTDIPIIAQSVQSIDSDIDDDLKLDEFALNEIGQNYIIEYFYPSSSEYEEPYLSTSDNVGLNGRLQLKNFPTLTEENPIIFFRAYRDGDSFNTKSLVQNINGDPIPQSFEEFPLSTKNEELICQWRILTNPIDGELILNNKCPKSNAPFQVFDPTGNLIYEGTAIDSFLNLKLENLLSGMYFIKIGDQSLKFIKL